MTQYGDYRKFDSEPTKEQLTGAVAEILGDLIDALREQGKEIYDCNLDRIKIIPKKPNPIEFNGEIQNTDWTVGIKLMID